MVGADAIVVCHLVSAEISAAQGAASSFLMKDRHLGGGHFCRKYGGKYSYAAALSKSLL